MTTYKGKPVTTWADGYGYWHARVEFPDTGYGNTGELSLDANWDSIRAAARRAIRAELVARDGADYASDYRLNIRVQNVSQSPSTMVYYSAEFIEQ